MHLNKKIGVKGHFTLHKGTSEEDRQLVADFDNLVLDSGLDYFGVGRVPMGYCHVGISNTTPSAGQMGLISPIAATYATPTGLPSTYALDTEAFKIIFTAHRRFNAGVFDNDTIAEIGMGYRESFTYSTYPMFSRALIVDEFGDPTTITLSALEYLDVTYTLELYFNGGDTVGTFSDGTNTYNYTLRLRDFSSLVPSQLYGINLSNLYNCTAHNGLILGTPLGSPTVTATNTSSSMPSVSYVAGSFSSVLKAIFNTTAGITNNEYDGLSLYIGNSSGRTINFQVSISPAIPKYSEGDATPNSVTFTFSISWGRV
jgi:hypothetical protein